MKSMLIIAGAIFTALILVNTGFAETYNKSLGIGERTIAGKVDSINVSKDLFVIRDSDVPKYEVVHAFSDQMASLQTGQSVVAVAKGDSILFLQGK